MDQNMSMFLAPWGLALGCALVAVSGLYLFDVRFLRSKLEATAAFLCGVFIICMAELGVIADSGAYFFQGQKMYVANCYAEGETAHPGQRASRDNEAGRHVEECLTRLGYDWSPEHEKCRNFMVPTNAFCYMPSGLVSRWVTRFQMMFE